jgi:hypothetical protein
MSRKKCLNCDETLIGKYCGHCGQKSDVKRIDWHHLVHDIPHSIFHLEKGFFLTLKMMIVSPGMVIREYLDGKRAKYFRPLTYLFILGTIAGLIYLKSPLYMEMAKTGESLEMAGMIQNLVGKYYNIISVALIPIYSFFVWLFYRRERNFVEIVTAHFFIMGSTSIFAVTTLVFLVSTDMGLVFGISMISSLASLTYYVYAYSTTFVTRKLSSRIWIGILLVILNNLITVIIAIVLAGYYITYILKRDNLELEFTL